MRRWLFGFVCGALAFGALPLLAEDFVRVVPGAPGGLESRVKLLEQAVEQLQGKVYGAAAPVKAPDPGVTCVLETPFDGAFSANSVSEETAREETIKRCREKGKGNIYCVRSGVKCQH